MLDFFRMAREPGAASQEVRGICERVASEASEYLKILDPVLGDKELVKAVAVELAKLHRG